MGFRHVLQISYVVKSKVRKSTTPKIKKNNWSAVKTWLKGFVVLGIGMALLSSVYFYGGNAWRSFSEHPVEQILVEGVFENVTKKLAMDIITAEIKDNFLQVNLQYLQSMLEMQPWIESAVVARRWPNALVVKIAEQQPIARWGEVGFLNQKGEVIYTKGNDNLLSLPWLFGGEQESLRIMLQYQNLSLLLRSRSLFVDRLWVDSKNSWQMKLKNGINIVLGKSDLLVKMQRFIKVYDQYLLVNVNAIATVDLRYVNGLAVEWTDEYTVTLENAG